MNRVYNFSDPSDLWKEINIYKGLELIPDINFYKSFTKIEVKEKTVKFLWFLQILLEISIKLLLRMFL